MKTTSPLRFAQTIIIIIIVIIYLFIYLFIFAENKNQKIFFISWETSHATTLTNKAMLKPPVASCRIITYLIE